MIACSFSGIYYKKPSIVHELPKYTKTAVIQCDILVAHINPRACMQFTQFALHACMQLSHIDLHLIVLRCEIINNVTFTKMKEPLQ